MGIPISVAMPVSNSNQGWDCLAVSRTKSMTQMTVPNPGWNCEIGVFEGDTWNLDNLHLDLRRTKKGQLFSNSSSDCWALVLLIWHFSGRMVCSRMACHVWKPMQSWPVVLQWRFLAANAAALSLKKIAVEGTIRVKRKDRRLFDVVGFYQSVQLAGELIPEQHVWEQADSLCFFLAWSIPTPSLSGVHHQQLLETFALPISQSGTAPTPNGLG